MDILPALPSAWAAKGSFSGLCARGVYEISCTWRDGNPVKVIVLSKGGGPRPDVRFRGQPCPFEFKINYAP